MNISKSIEPYFNYYKKKYPAIKDGEHEIIIIPIKDGSRSLDNYFINPLKANGYEYKENFLLSEIYMIK